MPGNKTNETQKKDKKKAAFVLLSEPHFVIAIGASAGGLEAIHEFFDNMPETGNLSFIVIQHLSPAHKSLLVELVSKHTSMNVAEAAHNMLLQKSCVYIIPNNKIMTIRNGKVQLAQKSPEKVPNNAIDVFLCSLANDKGPHAIAVILSGTGSDGTKGAEAIKKAGGLVIVQSPNTAKFDGMPNSVVASGCADLVLPPVLMPGEIYNRVNEVDEDVQLDNLQEYYVERIMQLVKNHTGHDFHYYKAPTILRRIGKRMDRVGITRLEDYVEYVTRNTDESEILVKEFLIGVTRFFRDKAAFDLLEKKVLPEIIRRKSPGELLKVWVNACSTGEEAYSIAILIEKCMAEQGKLLDVKIFATDLDSAAIEYAARATYPNSINKDIQKELLDQFFVAEGKKYIVVPAIRKKVVFARHNVLKDPPFIHNDLVTCRNMLIYMSSVLQNKVMGTIDFALRSEGYLFLGPSENISAFKENFQEMDSKWKVYKKISSSRVFHADSIMRRTDLSTEHRSTRAPVILPVDRKAVPTLVEDFKDALADEFSYAALYIDKKYDVKEAIGDFTAYLSLPERRLNFNLLKMLKPELPIALNAAIRQAWKENAKVSVHPIRIKSGDESFNVHAFVKPYPPAHHSFTLIVLWRTPDRSVIDNREKEVARHLLTPENHSLIIDLESELQETRSNLQMAIEGLETANEEMQSSNEELLSANEELQSSNEELQSLNEELHTLNTEHQLKIRELIELNDDLDNYFRSTDIGQLFVDAEMRIRKFNPAAVKLINLIESDVGRPIDHISTNIENENIQSDIKAVLKTRRVIEKEIRLSSGAISLMRIFPYIRSDQKTDGVVMTFVDISMIKNLDNIIKGIFDSTQNAIIAYRSQRSKPGEISDFRIITANQAADRLLMKSFTTAAGQSLKGDFSHLCHNGEFKRFVKVVEENDVYHDEFVFNGAEVPFTYEVIGVKLMDGIIVTYTDITDKKDAEQRLQKSYGELIVVKDNLKRLNDELEIKVKERTRDLSESEERFRLVSQATNDAIWDWNLSGNDIWFSDTFYTMTGYKREQGPAQRSFWEENLHPADRQRVMNYIESMISKKETKWSLEYRFKKADGNYALILDRGYLLRDEHQTPYRLLGSMMDITNLRKAEEAAVYNLEQREFLAESMPLMVFTAGAEGNIEFLNHQFPGYTGIPIEEAVKKGIEVSLRDEDIPAYREAWHRALANRNEFSQEVFMRRKDGQYRWQLMRVCPKLFKESSGSSWVGTIIDIHERRMATEELERRVKERTRDLERANKELELSNTELQQYAFVASHDLKEPLRKIYIFSNMVRDAYLLPNSDQAKDIIGRVINSSQRMMKLIEDLLNYSKLSQAGFFEPLDLNVLVHDILSDLEVVITEKKAVIDMEELCVIEGVQGQIRQVFQNLISNALKFTRRGQEPVIHVSCETVNEKEFDAEADKEGRFCRICIKDNGIGFDGSFVEKIFTLFQRLHTTEKYEGTGIGLAITRKIIEKHNGIITAVSSEGRGATFIIVLPLQAPALDE